MPCDFTAANSGRGSPFHSLGSTFQVSVMNRLFQGLAIVWVLLVEVFFLWASFRHGVVEGFGRYLGAHVNPLVVIYYVPAIFFFWLSSKFKE